MTTRHRHTDVQRSGFAFNLNMHYHFAVHSVHMVTIARVSVGLKNIITVAEKNSK